jgi:tRNA(Arg) A34 adenosine deaminase TadA
MQFPPIEIPLPDWLESVLPAPDAVFASDEERMRLAVALALNNVEHRTGGPFGAAIFDSRTGRFISPGMNLVIARNNSMLHAEAVAIMLAQRALGTYDLSSADGCLELYSSVEPCAMCLGAVHWSGVRRLVCGGRDDDARGIGFDEGHKAAEGVTVIERSGIAVRRDVLREEAVAVLRRYVELGGSIY